MHVVLYNGRKMVVVAVAAAAKTVSMSGNTDMCDSLL